MANGTNSTLHILMVDDNAMDIELMQRSFRRADVPHELAGASNGQAAMDLLADSGSTNRRPDLILLDLNMPRKDGFEVLEELKDNLTLRSIPVVVYTSSTHPEDIRRSYALHANSYIPKPVSYDELVEIAAAIGRYWLRTVAPPRP